MALLRGREETRLRSVHFFTSFVSLGRVSTKTQKSTEEQKVSEDVILLKHSERLEDRSLAKVDSLPSLVEMFLYDTRPAWSESVAVAQGLDPGLCACATCLWLHVSMNRYFRPVSRPPAFHVG